MMTTTKSRRRRACRSLGLSLSSRFSAVLVAGACFLPLTFGACAATTSQKGTTSSAYDDEDATYYVGEHEPDGFEGWGLVDEREAPSYESVVRDVVAMTRDRQVVADVRRRGLHVVNVMWEDTGRAKGSALGPNISDLTLQVRYQSSEYDRERRALMPVIRYPNFSDRTADIRSNRFFVRVGNEKGEGLRSVPLTKFLRNIRRYLSVPESVKGSGNLLARRDKHFLVSAQAVFLPIPASGEAEFNPVIFNYQSAPKSPAVLSILVTRQGTSVAVVENRNGGTRYGQPLYYNNNGQRAAFTAERRSDVAERIAEQGGPQSEDDESALERGADALFLIQVPLKHRHRGRLGGISSSSASAKPQKKSKSKPAPSKRRSVRSRSDVEQAVLGHGRDRGPVVEGNNLKLERDPRFPIRITVQFYKATSNGVVNASDLDNIADSIASVYEHADYVGSLVVPEGDTNRPTEWQSMPREWFPW